MTASHIYINAQGVPCAPMKAITDIMDWSTQGSKVKFSDGSESMMHGNPTDILNEVKASCIPIREEDRGSIGKMLGVTPEEIEVDTFYPVEPYEFNEIFIPNGHHGEDGFPPYGDRVARIIRPSEPLFEQALRSVSPEVKKEVDRQFEKLSEPKAGPSKELYSIAPLEWISIDEGMWEANVMDLHYEVWSNRGGCWVTLSSSRSKKCKDIEDGKQQAFEHCKGILTNYLIKES